MLIAYLIEEVMLYPTPLLAIFSFVANDGITLVHGYDTKHLNGDGRLVQIGRLTLFATAGVNLSAESL